MLNGRSQEQEREEQSKKTSISSTTKLWSGVKVRHLDMQISLISTYFIYKYYVLIC